MRAIGAALVPVDYPAGAVICRQDEPGASLFLVASGRVLVTHESREGGRRLLETLGRGDHFGEMAVLTSGPRSATATAVSPTRLLELKRERFEELLLEIPGFAANLSRALVVRLRAETARKRKRHRSSVVAIVDPSGELVEAQIASPCQALARALVARHERVVVLTDRPRKWAPDANYLIERIPAASDEAARVALVLERAQRIAERHDRVLLELTAPEWPGSLGRLLEASEEIWWLLTPKSISKTCESLLEPAKIGSDSRERVHLAWLLESSREWSPVVPAEWGIATQDIKLTLDPNAPPDAAPFDRASLTRWSRRLRGTRVGLALGGGGARGLAHLGVLRAFEREGVVVDMLAGASSGALMGISYAGGWMADDALREFKRMLTPRKFVRALPGGTSWHLWTMFRRRAWEGMLREYLRDVTLERLPTPLATVAVDLVSGTQVVRDRGDATHAVLESINIPFVAKPILRDGMALIDGGLLNNVPGDLLPERGAELVIGVDVTSKLAPYTPRARQKGKKRPKGAGVLETMLRISDIQSSGIMAMRSHAIDLWITPDCSRFAFTDFSKAWELAEVGEKAALEVAPRLKTMIEEIEAAQERSDTT